MVRSWLSRGTGWASAAAGKSSAASSSAAARQKDEGPRRGHARVQVGAVVLLDPLVRLLHAVVVLGDAAVDQAFDAGVGHAAVAGQPRLGGGLVVHLGDAAAGRRVNEAAVLDFTRPV